MEEPEEYLKNAEIVAYESIQDIISLGSDMLYQNYISEKSIPFSVKSTIDMLFSLLESYHMRHESQEVPEWNEDLEPSSSSIDTWARSAIPVKTKTKMPQAEQSSFVVPPDARSSVSFSSRRSGLGRMLRSNRNNNNKTPKENNPIEEVVIPMPIYQDKNEVSEEEEMLRIRKEREMIRKKEDSERVKKVKQEEIEKEKKAQKESDEMKKKLFTYDHKGKIIFVNPIKHENIPDSYVALKYLPEEIPKEEPKQPAKRNPPKDFAAIKRLKSAPLQEREWVKNITSIQPPLYEALKLSANVTFIDGPRIKHSIENHEEKTMSRKQYNAIYQPKPETVANITADSPIKKSPSVSSTESLKKSPDSKKDLLDLIPDYEQVSERSSKGRKILSSLSPTRALQQHGKVIQFGTNFNLDDSVNPNQKFNAEILRNKSWGLNPAFKDPVLIERLPKRPSSKEIRGLYGDILKKPKDHPFITPQELWQAKGAKIKKPRDRPHIERVEKKTRMPPPPYGFTMINALPENISLAISGSGNNLSKL